jgi:hypothetical protein
VRRRGRLLFARSSSREIGKSVSFTPDKLKM